MSWHVHDIDDRTRAVLEARARLYARPLDEDDRTPSFEAVVFELGTDRYAIAVEFVLRVAHLPAPARLPAVPPYFAGLTNIRGHLLAVVDLAALLGAPSGATTPYVIVLGRDAADIGITASAVCEMRRIARGDAAAERSHGGGALVVRALPDGCMLLDGAALLDDPRLVVPDNSTKRVPVKEATP